MAGDTHAMPHDHKDYNETVLIFTIVIIIFSVFFATMGDSSVDTNSSHTFLQTSDSLLLYVQVDSCFSSSDDAFIAILDAISCLGASNTVHRMNDREEKISSTCVANHSLY
jgi:hypothetical protein